MKRMNLGCATDYKDGWTNVDRINFGSRDREVIVWDATRPPSKNMNFVDYDFVLVNHVLCTMNHTDVDKALDNIHAILKPGGKLQIIDMDLFIAFAYYDQGSEDLIPASGASLDEKFVNHVSGFGTRKSLYTVPFIVELLYRHGYRNVEVLGMSEHDLRPMESFVVEAQK